MVTLVTEVTLNQIANLRKKKTFQDTLVILVTMVTWAPGTDYVYNTFKKFHQKFDHEESHLGSTLAPEDRFP